MQVFVLSQQNVKEKGYVTLFQYMTKNKKSAFARVVMSAPEFLQVRSPAAAALHVLQPLCRLEDSTVQSTASSASTLVAQPSVNA